MVFGLALAPVCTFAQQQAVGDSSANTGSQLEEVIVTAQKRAERLRDVPVPVTAVTADALLEQNQLRAQDFFSSVPGLDLQIIDGRSNLAIRGITTGPATGNPVVGYTVDDVPFGSSAGLSGLFGITPDLDPSELAGIEVLRGPQGTLYGASSIGGLVKYVTVDPSVDRLSGIVAADMDTIYAGHGPGYNVRGAVNIPLGETLAVRASAFTREDPGYIDNVVTGKTGVNMSEVAGGRLSTLWRPSDTLSVKLSAMYQSTKTFGTSEVDVSLGGGLLQSNDFGSGPSEANNQVYSAIVTDKIGRSELTSVSSYSESSNYDTLDYSALFNSVWPSIYGVASTATVTRQDYSTRKVTQEVRLATPILERLDWLVGAFYTHETTPYTIRTRATLPADGTVIAEPIYWNDTQLFSEYAAFTDLTARFTDQFNVQLGARYSSNSQTIHHREYSVLDLRGFYSDDPTSSDHAVTALFTPQYKISTDHMVYARVATGYRPGGPNVVCGNQGGGVNIPCQYLSDKTTNYELGAKGDFLGRTFSYDVSLYDIDWKNIQVVQFVPQGAFNYTGNASRARSRGMELSFESRPLDGTTLALWGAWTDAVLRQGFDPDTVAIYGAAGDRLPYSARFSGRVSVDQEAPLTGDVWAFLGAEISYVGERVGEFVSSAEEAPLRQQYPAYAKTDLHAGVKTESWRVSAFVKNATDRRGVTGGGYNNQTNFNPYWFNYIQPRTIGLSVERTF